MNKTVALVWALLLAGCGGGGGGAVPAVQPQSAPRASLSIAAIGDSITAGYVNGGSPASPGGAYVLDPSHAYPALVGSKLGATVTNLGVPGATTAAILTQAAAVSADTSIVLVNAGTNDLWPITGTLGHVQTETAVQAEANLDAIVAAIRVRAPNAKIVLVDLRDYARTLPTVNGAGIESAVTALDHHILAEQGVTTVELANRPGADDLTLFPDAVHPSLQGAAWIADAVSSVL